MTHKIETFFFNNRRFIPLSVTVILFFAAYIFGAYSYVGMREPQVFLNLFRSSSFLMISAIGSTFVILAGGIDLSVPGIMALTTVASAALLRTGEWDAWVVMLLMLVMGMAFGAILGAFITYMKVQPFIATLAGMWFTRGLCFFISDDAIAISNRVYTIIGQTKLLIPGLADPVTKQGAFISPLVVLEVIVLIVALYLAHYTRFGRTVYAVGGNEQSARLMGLPVNQTKMLVYTMNGFCSALAGIALSISVSSGHGLYAPGFEMTVIAAVVIGGTMLTGGEGYVFGTVFGVLITSVIQTLIQFNGKLSSWWTNIGVGLLTLAFIIVQSLLAARKTRQLAARRQMEEGASEQDMARQEINQRKRVADKSRRYQYLGAAAIAGLLLVILIIYGIRGAARGSSTSTPLPTTSACQLKPFRQELAAEMMKSGALIAYERNGGPECIDEVYGIFPDGKIIWDNGVEKIEKQAAPADVMKLLEDISAKGWFTDEMYSTSHVPCGQCYTYFISVYFRGQEKTIQAVDGGTDAPANYWQVVSIINGVLQIFNTAP
ncbi:MAG: hypothetical protein JXB15_11070 [Anaerolineales bacterium]|nr:hypothetical protein [Anaerolineales bacterium]